MDVTPYSSQSALPLSKVTPAVMFPIGDEYVGRSSCYFFSATLQEATKNRRKTVTLPTPPRSNFFDLWIKVQGIPAERWGQILVIVTSNLEPLPWTQEKCTNKQY